MAPSGAMMSNTGFHLMKAMFAFIDLFFPYIDRRIKWFPGMEGKTVVDYGCGPGRYTVRFAGKVGRGGMVFAVDIHPLAIRAVERKMRLLGLRNVRTFLARGYDSGIETGRADMVFALDMFFKIKDPQTFLRELYRISTPSAVLIIDGGHQSKAKTIQKINDAHLWKIAEEKRDHFVCVKEAG